MRTASKSIDPMSKKANLHVYFFAHCFFCCFAKLKRETSLIVTDYFFEELSYVITKNFFACAPVRLAGRQYFLFSHRRYEIFMFFFQRNSSPLFSVTHFSCFSVIHLSVDKKCCCFFLSKSPGGHTTPYQIKVVFGLPYLLIELFYIGVCVVQPDGRSVGRTYGHVSIKISLLRR